MRHGARVLIAPLRAYQRVLSPLLGPRCRFHPTCSQFAIDALERFGVMRGVYLAVRRVLRCHPWGGSGFDEVPDAFSWRRAPERTPARSGT